MAVLWGGFFRWIFSNIKEKRTSLKGSQTLEKSREEMGFSEEIIKETDKSEQFSLLKSQRVENGKIDGSFQEIKENPKAPDIGSPPLFESYFSEEIINETYKSEQFFFLRSQRVENGKIFENIKRILEKCKALAVHLYEESDFSEEIINETDKSEQFYLLNSHGVKNGKIDGSIPEVKEKLKVLTTQLCERMGFSENIINKITKSEQFFPLNSHGVKNGKIDGSIPEIKEKLKNLAIQLYGQMYITEKTINEIAMLVQVFPLNSHGVEKGENDGTIQEIKEKPEVPLFCFYETSFSEEIINETDKSDQFFPLNSHGVKNGKIDGSIPEIKEKLKELAILLYECMGFSENIINKIATLEQFFPLNSHGIEKGEIDGSIQEMKEKPKGPDFGRRHFCKELDFSEKIINENDKSEQFFPLNSHGVKNRKIDGSIPEIKEKQKGLAIQLDGLKQRKITQLPLTSFLRFASLITNILLIPAVIVIVVQWKAAEDPLSTRPAVPVASCPDDWVGYRSRCYYFSDAEADWESSKNHCLALNASLAVVDSQKEMEFLKRHKTIADHWIGLQRYSEAYPWKWTNGTAFNNWFDVRGGAECAYINKKGFASSSCDIIERWICSRPM